jgi:DNA invertase Pin-like site-specific DNA recombinase
MNLVIGYTRCSTQEQADSGLGIEAQMATIKSAWLNRREAATDPIGITWYSDPGVSGSTPWEERPQLSTAIQRLNKEGGTLMVAKLDRLSRSLQDFADIMALSQKHKWSLVALDLGVDTSTPVGEMVAGIMASISQFERKLIGQRTKEALAAKKERGEKVGRTSTVSEKTLWDLQTYRGRGYTYAYIAGLMNDSGVEPPQAHGKMWYASSVRAVLKAAQE